jgi:hypothetical protein
MSCLLVREVQPLSAMGLWKRVFARGTQHSDSVRIVMKGPAQVFVQVRARVHPIHGLTYMCSATAIPCIPWESLPGSSQMLVCDIARVPEQGPFRPIHCSVTWGRALSWELLTWVVYVFCRAGVGSQSLCSV